MRALIQRVSSGSVSVKDQEISAIGPGFVILLGIREGDTETEMDYLVKKISGLRVFEDDEGKMNRSLIDAGGEALVISQFTLYADTSKGRRPSFVKAARPEIAEPLVDEFAARLKERGVPVKTGSFGAHMLVDIQNDGPVTIMIDRDPESLQSG